MIRRFSVPVILIILLLAGNARISAASGTSGDAARDVLKTSSAEQDTASTLIQLLDSLAAESDDALFQLHCNSIIAAIQSRTTLSAAEQRLINDMYITFADPSVTWNSSEMSTYMQRKRPYIVAWTSPTDGAVSLGWLYLPSDLDSLRTYPLYVILHGLYGPYGNSLEYMTIPFKSAPAADRSFDDGYAFYPWGRGNIWYEGIGETDVWEGIRVIESVVRIDPAKKYLAGHSMGGYGAWTLAANSPGTWAAVGIYAGAFTYDTTRCFSDEALQNLRDVPVYTVCGSYDSFLAIDLRAYQLLQAHGNTHCTFVSFNGGHESTLINWSNMNEWMKNYTNPNPISIRSVSPGPFPVLLTNYPNPFNPTTTIRYQIPDRMHVRLSVRDILGRDIAVLADADQEPGTYMVPFRADRISSGIYFSILNAGNTRAVRKIVLLR